MTVTGTGLSNPQAPVVWVKFGGIKGTNLVVVNDTTLTVTTPAHVAADVRVRVVQYATSSAASSAARFTYSAAPTISSKSPPDGPPSGGTSVTIRGTGFTGATSVTFDGIAASFTVDSDSQITAVSPPHASGFVDVTITTPHGTVVDPADQFPFIYD